MIIFQQIVYIFDSDIVRTDYCNNIVILSCFIENYFIFINIIFVLFILNYGPINWSLCFQFNDEKIQYSHFIET